MAVWSALKLGVRVRFQPKFVFPVDTHSPNTAVRRDKILGFLKTSIAFLHISMHHPNGLANLNVFNNGHLL